MVPYGHPSPVGMRKIRGIALKSTIPRAVKTIMKPVFEAGTRTQDAGSRNRRPSTPPMTLNIPRRPDDGGHLFGHQTRYTRYLPPD